MLREKNLFAFARDLVFRQTLLMFTLFIGLGNVPRFIESSLFSDHLLVSEAFLYALSFISLGFLQSSLRAYLTLCTCSFFVFLSFLYGCSLWGFDAHSALYALRLVAFFITSFSVSSICLEKFQGNISSFFSFLLKSYGISLFFSFLILIFFFSSESLWKGLQLVHIFFHGDPHVGRFVSVYFDPNYYAAIVGIPLLLSMYLYQKTEKKKYALLFGLFGLSALLTWSRSGLFLLFILFSFLFCLHLDRRGFSRGKLKGLCFLVLGALIFACCFLEDLTAFFLRFFLMSQDESALARMYTFNWGISFWKQHPLFGMGYNFLYSRVKEEIGLNSLDSSLLSLFIQIGAIPFLGLLCYGGYKLQGVRSYLLLWKQKELKVPYFLLGFLMYSGLIIFFASHFNQLLFYPFWSLPFAVIVLFLKKAVKKKT